MTKTIKKVALAICAFVFGLAAVYLLATSALVFWPDVRDYVDPQEFTSERWRDAAYEALDPVHSRWRMRYSLTRKYDLIGMSRTDVEALLGDGGEDSTLYYSLGPTGRGPNYGVLTLTLDGRGRVEEYDFYQH